MNEVATELRTKFSPSSEAGRIAALNDLQNAESSKCFIDELRAYANARVEVYGWICSVRQGRDIQFITISDRTGEVQVAFRNQDKSKAIPHEKSRLVRVLGRVSKSADDRFGHLEIVAESIEGLAPEAPSSIARMALDPPRHIQLRSRDKLLIFEIQATLERALREYLTARRFIEIHTPKISSGGSESGSEVFTVDYFGKPACLIQSPQFYMQLAMAAGADRVFEIGPVFRAEPGITNRHATEFTCFEVEVAGINSHEELMVLEENLLRYALSVVADAHGTEISRRFGVPVEIPTIPIPRIPVERALKLTSTFDGRLTYRVEQAVCKHIQQQYNHGFVFLTNFPAADRPFYTMACGSKDGGAIKSRSFDLLWRGVEITSGCQREHRFPQLEEQASRAGLCSGATSDYIRKHYLQMFRDGCPPHGGFGIGINRLMLALLGMTSIRDTSFVFRGPDCLVP